MKRNYQEKLRGPYNPKKVNNEKGEELNKIAKPVDNRNSLLLKTSKIAWKKNFLVMKTLKS